MTATLTRDGAPRAPRSVAVAIGVLLLAGVAAGAGAAVKPTWMLAVLAGGAAVVIGALRPQVTLALFLVSIPLEYGWEIHGNPTLTITKFAGGLCFLSFALAAVITRRRLRFDGSHALILAILCLGLASTVHAGDESTALSTTIRYANWALLYVVLTQFAGSRPGTLRFLVRALVGAAAYAGVWGSLNFLTGKTELARLTYGQQNDYAFVLASVLFLAFWLVRVERGVFRILAALSVAGILAGIVLSLSRGAYLAVFAGLVVFVVWHRRQAKLVIGLLLVAAAGTAALVAINPVAVQQGIRGKQAVANENVTSRLTLWRGAIQLSTANPVVGIGPGNFGAYYYQITHEPVETPALTEVHNTYLELAAELGPLGLVLFLGFIGLSLSRLTVAIRTGAGPPDLALFLRLALVAVCAGMLTTSEEFFAPIWLLGGFATLVWLERPSVSST